MCIIYSKLCGKKMRYPLFVLTRGISVPRRRVLQRDVACDLSACARDTSEVLHACNMLASWIKWRFVLSFEACAAELPNHGSSMCHAMEQEEAKDLIFCQVRVHRSRT